MSWEMEEKQSEFRGGKEVKRSESNNEGKINGRCLGRFSVALAKMGKGVHAEEGKEFHTVRKRLLSGSSITDGERRHVNFTLLLCCDSVFLWKTAK